MKRWSDYIDWLKTTASWPQQLKMQAIASIYRIMARLAGFATQNTSLTHWEYTLYHGKLRWRLVGYNDAAQFSPRNPDGTLKDPSFYNNHAGLFREPRFQS